MKEILKPPIIPENEKSPLVLQLLALIEQQSSIVQHQPGRLGFGERYGLSED